MSSEALVCAVGYDGRDRIVGARDAMQHALRYTATKRPLLDNLHSLIDYLTFTMAAGVVEQARALYLDANGRLLVNELVATGSIDNVSIHLRPIIHRALDVGAAGMILVHNHPSGDIRPSDADRSLTIQLANAARAVDVRLLDHLIVSLGNWMSFRESGLL